MILLDGVCNRAVTATATTRAPTTSEGCPGGTHRENEHLEVIRNPDIRVEGTSTLEEREPEESREGELETRGVAEPEEEKNAEPEDEAEDPEKWRNTDITTEMPTGTNERRDQTRHVPGGAWLTQTLEEREPEESLEGEPETRGVAEPQEEKNEEPENEAEDPEKWRNTDITTETPTETNERRDPTRHVPGGAWLTQTYIEDNNASANDENITSYMDGEVCEPDLKRETSVLIQCGLKVHSTSQHDNIETDRDIKACMQQVGDKSGPTTEGSDTTRDRGAPDWEPRHKAGKKIRAGAPHGASPT
ncbi:hypothetical protein NDU88_004479 [Pleurodeles waltl]|uniref:Uncharacterized protein n=1 Tax=Pleurodeles waltl TaxID=8319 RepID=A0AAV7TTN8_PLEWA|nr:hypothetical protein NDU88_004479 [Pleurodeles waltl]